MKWKWIIIFVYVVCRRTRHSGRFLLDRQSKIYGPSMKPLILHIKESKLDTEGKLTCLINYSEVNKNIDDKQ